MDGPLPDDAVSLVPEGDLATLAAAARRCTACPLYRTGAQTVFGEGPASAAAMLVGEQPGDAEDRAGHPFVGPAGQLLDRALREAGIERNRTYVTNAVKHFKWEPRGKRRIHSKPNAREVQACLPWLKAEIDRVRPAVVVCLGTTAAQALLGRDFRVTRQRGEILEGGPARYVVATVHPSAILRAAPADHAAEYGRFVADLARVADLLRKLAIA